MTGNNCTPSESLSATYKYEPLDPFTAGVIEISPPLMETVDNNLPPLEWYQIKLMSDTNFTV